MNPLITPKPTLDEWLDNELLGAQNFFPDDNSKREGYIAALEAVREFLDTP